MLHARVIRPPHCRLRARVAWTKARSRAFPGARVVREQDFIAVVAPREWDAVRAAETLKVNVGAAVRAVSDDGEPRTITSARRKRPARGAPVNIGDVAAALKARAARDRSRIRMAAAVAREHGACLRRRRRERRPATRVDRLAEAALRALRERRSLLGMPVAKVRTMWIPGPGSYGRNDAGDAARGRGAACRS